MQITALTVLAVLVACRAAAGFDRTQFVASARSQIGVTTGYDGAFPT